MHFRTGLIVYGFVLKKRQKRSFGEKKGGLLWEKRDVSLIKDKMTKKG
jgi:hypothetical protein